MIIYAEDIASRGFPRNGDSPNEAGVQEEKSLE